MLGEKIKIQSRVNSDYTDEQLLLIKQMGIKYVYVIFSDEDSNYDSVMRFMNRLDKFGLTCTDAGNVGIYKNAKIHLGLPGRDEAIENKVLTSKWAVGEKTRGAVARIVDTDQLAQLPYTHGRLYTKEEMWDNFKYFLDRVLPVCEDIDLKLALHPNDPPVDCLCGISNLITSAEDYKHAFELAGNSPYLGMKMCIGCWLEGGEHFGNVLEDIKYFVENKKVLCVHFRNVSNTIPRFEETLLEDGYMDMYKVMKEFVKADYDGVLHADHVPLWGEGVGTGGSTTAWTYSMGYIKALWKCAMAEVNK